MPRQTNYSLDQLMELARKKLNKKYFGRYDSDYPLCLILNEIGECAVGDQDETVRENARSFLLRMFLYKDVEIRSIAFYFLFAIKDLSPEHQLVLDNHSAMPKNAPLVKEVQDNLRSMAN